MQGVVAADKFSVFMLASIYRRQRAALERDGMNPEEASENAAAALSPTNVPTSFQQSSGCKDASTSIKHRVGEISSLARAAGFEPATN